LSTTNLGGRRKKKRGEGAIASPCFPPPASKAPFKGALEERKRKKKKKERRLLTGFDPPSPRSCSPRAGPGEGKEQEEPVRHAIPFCHSGDGSVKRRGSRKRGKGKKKIAHDPMFFTLLFPNISWPCPGGGRGKKRGEKGGGKRKNPRQKARPFPLHPPVDNSGKGEGNGEGRGRRGRKKGEGRAAEFVCPSWDYFLSIYVRRKGTRWRGGGGGRRKGDRMKTRL